MEVIHNKNYTWKNSCRFTDSHIAKLRKSTEESTMYISPGNWHFLHVQPMLSCQSSKWANVIKQTKLFMISQWYILPKIPKQMVQKIRLSGAERRGNLAHCSTREDLHTVIEKFTRHELCLIESVATTFSGHDWEDSLKVNKQMKGIGMQVSIKWHEWLSVGI